MKTHVMDAAHRKFLLTVCLSAVLVVFTFSCKSRTNSSGLRSDAPSHDVDRPAEARKAVQTLMDVNLYSEGKGLIFPAKVTKKKFLEQGPKKIQEDLGLILSRGEVIGISEQPVGNDKIMVVGCALCHVGKAAGIIVPGLGNKTVDVYQIAESNKTLLKLLNLADHVTHPLNRERAAFIKKSMALSEFFQQPQYDTKVRGVAPPMSTMSRVLEVLGVRNPPAFAAPTKIMHVWGYEPKRKEGAFYDGFVLGVPPGPAGLTMFIGNYDRRTYESMIPEMEKAEEAFGKLLPPVYPYEIDRSAAMRGKETFSDHCESCHGSHERDAQQLPIFEAPDFIDINVVRTDPYRTDMIDEYRAKYSKTVEESWLGAYVKTGKKTRGYFSPKLWGVWARFPYLHNGSVPTVADLLTSPEKRPKSFNMRNAGEEYRFDQKNLGLSVNRLTPEKKKNRDRDIYTTEGKGFSNRGHEFGTALSSEEKLDLIEFLKSL